jgi:hypothetical protein
MLAQLPLLLFFFATSFGFFLVEFQLWRTMALIKDNQKFLLDVIRLEREQKEAT